MPRIGPLAMFQILGEAQQLAVSRPGALALLKSWLLPGAPDVIGPLRHRGLRFFARLADWHAVHEVLFAGEYDVVADLLDGVSAPVVVDLGANIGMLALKVFAQHPQAVVHAVEPGRMTFGVLERNREANPALRWHTHRAAVWSEDGSVAFAEHEASVSSRVSDVGMATPAVSLATLLTRRVGERVDVLKVDIEGSEEAALCGHEGLLRDIGHAIVELHPASCDAPRVVTTLRAAFPRLYTVPGRVSAKPLLVATRRALPLPAYEGPCAS